MQIEERNDVGQLWENFLISERLKYNTYQHKYSSSYFWRLHTGAEIDYVEENAGIMNGYELKWRKKESKCPEKWNKTYIGSTYTTVNQENYLSFITKNRQFN